MFFLLHANEDEHVYLRAAALVTTVFFSVSIVSYLQDVWMRTVCEHSFCKTYIKLQDAGSPSWHHEWVAPAVGSQWHDCDWTRHRESRSKQSLVFWPPAQSGVGPHTHTHIHTIQYTDNFIQARMSCTLTETHASFLPFHLHTCILICWCQTSLPTTPDTFTHVQLTCTRGLWSVLMDEWDATSVGHYTVLCFNKHNIQLLPV